MAKDIARNIQKGKARYDLLQDKTVKRFQQNATRLEHFNSKANKLKKK